MFIVRSITTQLGKTKVAKLVHASSNDKGVIFDHLVLIQGSYTSAAVAL